MITITCRHTSVIMCVRGLREVARRCACCRKMLSLGPANDASKAVRLEIYAVTTLDQWRKEQRERGRRGFCRVDDRLGWEAHAREEDPDSRGWAGWLMREIHTHSGSNLA